MALVIKNLPANEETLRDPDLIPWRRACKPTLVFLPGESHGQRSLVGFSPWGHTGSNTTEVT